MIGQIILGYHSDVSSTECGWGLRLLREGTVLVITVLMFFYSLFGNLRFKAYSTLIITFFLLVRLLYRYKYFSYGIDNIKNLGFIQNTKGLFLLILGTVISDFGNIYEIIFGKRKNLLNVSNTIILEEFSTNN